ncbi:serine dehydratase [Desulfosarcina widdelii]|uniref:L-serine ammonia-lyase n=1 Tax=Desulfosarcina widdelii TaxID=947919 RepID=A0A5K7Z9T8_9BACT|nr:L-serine ammonia-lyase, iron-sulfur-dependent, subunit alpha [Desulfosarcina widdelii]BBO73247.1 serine dehydratase [Desulfosarcina widdelii]
MCVYNASIFNEVFGPIMIGQSSSHTAGPARIGMMCHNMLPDDPEDIEITFDTLGSFAATYEGQGSDYGFIGGIMGIPIRDKKIKRSLITANEKGIQHRFIIKNLGCDLHPNFAHIKITTESGYVLDVEAASTGGGMFEITKYQGYGINFKGDCHEFVIFSKEPENVVLEVQKLLNTFKIGYRIHIVPGQEGKPALVNLKTDWMDDKEFQKALKAAVGADDSLYFRPILPVIKKMNCKVPFTGATDAYAYAKKNKIDELWRLAAAYESSISGTSIDDVLKMTSEILSIMRSSAYKAIAGGYRHRGFLPPQGIEMNRKISSKSVKQVDLGLLNRASLWASSIMEYNICNGLIVAAPTGGSSGVLPGAVVSVGEELGKTDLEIEKALLVGGLIGVFIDHRATFAAEVAACQAEIGSASAMAAASVVQLLGGSVKQGFAAAALALQNLLGLVCDPVAGVGNVPCVARNASGAATALVSANMALAGFDPCIPLDEVIAAMQSIGDMLAPELKCTGRGGLCITPTGKRIEESIDLTMAFDD